MISYKFKLHAKAKRDGFIGNKITRHIMLYNRIVELGDRFYKKYHRILRSKTINKYVQMKKHDPSWSGILDGLNSWAVQETIKRRDVCLDRFFRYLKRKSKNPNALPKESPPKKHRVYGEGSYKLNKGNGWKFVDGGIATGYLWPMFGKPRDIHTYKFFGNRKIEGEVKNLVFKRDACGDIWCSITTTHNAEKTLPKTGKVGGFDYSQEHFFVSDDGRFWDIPHTFEDGLDNLKKLSHRCRKAIRGSNNYRRLNHSLTVLYRRIENRRKALHYELAYRMCREYDVMCFEDNDYADMRLSKRIVNGHKVTKKQKTRLISYSPGKFIAILKEVAKKTGKKVFFADRYFASSQTCSECGCKNEKLKQLRIRKWKCPNCGATHDRDVNAARNLVKEFERTAGGASSVETETEKKSESESYWERIRKSASVKRAAVSEAKVSCPQGENEAKAEATVCQELYSDAYTVSYDEGNNKKNTNDNKNRYARRKKRKRKRKNKFVAKKVEGNRTMSKVEEASPWEDIETDGCEVW